MNDEPNDELGNRIATAVAARRPEPARGFEERMRAAALRPARMRWLIPLIAATAVAAVALAVVFVWRDRADDAQLAPIARVEPPPAPSPPPTVDPSPSKALPAGPVGMPRTVDFFDEYQAVIDGDLSSLGLDSAQTVRVRRIIDDYKRVLVQHLDESIRANTEMIDQIARTTPDTALMLVAYDRMLAAESAARRATMVARIAVRDVLTAAQRKILDGRPARPVVSTAPTPTPTPTPIPTPTPAPAPTPTATSVLSIMTAHGPADVVIDGKPVGVTPLEITLAHGRHAVRITQPGYLTMDRNIDLDRNTVMKLMLTPDAAASTGTLRITTRDPARIQIDGVDRGTTPLTLALPVGRHRVTATFARSKETRTIDITGGTTTTLTLADRMPPPGGGLTNPFDNP